MERRVTRRKRNRSGALASTAGGSRGFTLLEMLIALVILSVSILALTSVTITAIKVNLQNEIRNAAIRVTSERAATLLAQPIESVTSGNAITNAKLKGGTYQFTETWTVNPLTSDLREIVIRITYDYHGDDFDNTSVIYKHRAK